MPATLTRLDAPLAPVKVVILNASGTGIGLMTTSAIPPHTPVRVDWDDGLLLGEVVHVGREDSAFLLGITVQHSLTDLASLAEACGAFAA